MDDTITFKTIHKNLDELQDTMTSYEKQENEKREIITGMDKLVKSMLKTTMVSQAIQTEEPEKNLSTVNSPRDNSINRSRVRVDLPATTSRSHQSKNSKNSKVSNQNPESILRKSIPKEESLQLNQPSGRNQTL